MGFHADRERCQSPRGVHRLIWNSQPASCVVDWVPSAVSDPAMTMTKKMYHQGSSGSAAQRP
jgi:hypothetical protein